MVHAHLCFPPVLLAGMARPSDSALLPGVCGTPERRLAASLLAVPCALLPIAAACMTAEVSHDNAVTCSTLQENPCTLQGPSCQNDLCRACKSPFLPASYPCGVLPSAGSLCPAQLPCSAAPPAVQRLDGFRVWVSQQSSKPEGSCGGDSLYQQAHCSSSCWLPCGVGRGGMLVPALPCSPVHRM